MRRPQQTRTLTAPSRHPSRADAPKNPCDRKPPLFAASGNSYGRARHPPTVTSSARWQPVRAGNVQRRKVIHAHGVRRDSEPAGSLLRTTLEKPRSATSASDGGGRQQVGNLALILKFCQQAVLPQARQSPRPAFLCPGAGESPALESATALTRLTQSLAGLPVAVALSFNLGDLEHLTEFFLVSTRRP